MCKSQTWQWRTVGKEKKSRRGLISIENCVQSAIIKTYAMQIRKEIKKKFRKKDKKIKKKEYCRCRQGNKLGRELRKEF